MRASLLALAKSIYCLIILGLRRLFGAAHNRGWRRLVRSGAYPSKYDDWQHYHSETDRHYTAPLLTCYLRH